MFRSKMEKRKQKGKDTFANVGEAYGADSDDDDNDSDAGNGRDLFGDAVEFDSDSEDAAPAPPRKAVSLIGEKAKLDAIHAELCAHPDFGTKLLHLEAPNREHEVVGYVRDKPVTAFSKQIDLSQFDEATQVMFHEKKSLTEKITGQPISMFDVVHRHFNAGISRAGEANSRGEKGAAHSLTDSFDQAANLAGSPAPISVAKDPINDPVSFRKTHEASISRALDDGVIDDTFRAHLDAYARMSGQSASSTAKPTPLAIKTAHQMMQRALNDNLPDPRIGPSADAAAFVNALQAGTNFQQTIVVGGKPAIVTGEFSNTNGRKAYTVSAQMDPHPAKVAILEFMPSKKGNKQLTHALLEPNAPGKLVLHMEKVGQFFADAAQHMSVHV